jgi:hypothetical protein
MLYNQRRVPNPLLGRNKAARQVALHERYSHHILWFITFLTKNCVFHTSYLPPHSMEELVHNVRTCFKKDTVFCKRNRSEWFDDKYRKSTPSCHA